MKILVLGSGAREHAIILSLRSEQTDHEIFAAPGNAGIAQDATLVDLDQLDGAAVAGFANEHGIDLVVVGPEAPLVAGVADVLRERGIRSSAPAAPQRSWRARRRSRSGSWMPQACPPGARCARPRSPRSSRRSTTSAPLTS